MLAPQIGHTLHLELLGLSLHVTYPAAERTQDCPVLLTQALMPLESIANLNDAI